MLSTAVAVTTLLFSLRRKAGRSDAGAAKSAQRLAHFKHTKPLLLRNPYDTLP